MSKKKREFVQFNDWIARMYPEDSDGNKEKNGFSKKMSAKEFTFQVTDACNLACTYCYQTNKGVRRMPIETAKLAVDKLLSGEDGFGEYIGIENSPAIVLSFIGGEPFLEIDLIDEIVDYFRMRAIELNHPWATKFAISICSNGVLYRNEKVQKFLQKNEAILSFSVTVDGTKELHDACRIFPDGSPSYDLAHDAVKDWMSRGYYMGSKITIAPGNITYLFDSLKNMLEDGYDDINANCVYEKGWTKEHATELYNQCKQFTDWLKDSEYDPMDFSLSLLNEIYGTPHEESHLDNWCGGTGLMLSMDPDGRLFPCIRYMESSLGTKREPLVIGDVWNGIAKKQCEKNCIECLNKIDRRTQSTDECFYCPIASGCSWCFKAGTKISTPNGLVNIEDLKIGDKVYDKYGNIQFVENNMSRVVNSDDLVYVNASGLNNLLTTKEHPFLTKPVRKIGNKYKYGNIQWVKAEDLKISDRIALFIPKCGTKDVNKDFAYIIGQYVGNGWKTPSNRIKHPYKYYLCCDFSKQEHLESHLNNSGIKYSKSKNKTVEEYHLNISNNEYLIDLLEDCGRYAKNKHVPGEVKNWNKESIIAFLNGYFDADGTFDIKSNTQRFTSISYELVLNISELVRMVYHKNVNITKIYHPEKGFIGNRKINQATISYEGRFNTGNLKRKYYEYDKKNNIMWVNISNTKESIPNSETVYNLTVSNTHSYIADGAIVHNCSAYNYEETGTVDKRVTYICDMHKARCLATVYYWNTYYRNNNIDKVKNLWVPREWAEPIIGKEEYDKLASLTKELGGFVNENNTHITDYKNEYSIEDFIG